jgi:hypothetical protein
MLLLSQAKKAVLVCATAMLIGQYGCASPPVKSHFHVQSALSGERIGVVIQKKPGKMSLKTPEKEGVGSSISRGAAAGAELGYDIARFYQTFPLVSETIGTAVGSTVGAVYGAVVPSKDAPKWYEAANTFRAILVEIDFEHLFTERLISFAKENGYALHMLKGQTSGNDIPFDYRSFSREGINLVIELSEFAIELRPPDEVEKVIDPRRRFVISVRSRVLRTTDGTVLDDRIVSHGEMVFLTMDEWTLNKGALFRKEASIAPQGMADAVIMELLALDPLPGRVIHKAILGLKPYILFGPAPIDPPFETLPDIPLKVGSLQPTLRWEPFQGSEVTYDLKIWLSKDRWSPRVLIYSRQRLTDPCHTLETPLKPWTGYEWTVRARYRVAGQARITGWAMWTLKFDNLFDKIFPDRPPQYYHFRTP